MAQKKEYSDREGIVHPSYRSADMSEIPIEQWSKEMKIELVKENIRMDGIMKEVSKNFATTNLTIRNHTLDFLTVASMGKTPQFVKKADSFKRRIYTIKEATIYKFKEEMIKLWLENTKNDVGNRHMPRRNMFIDTYLEFDGLSVCGIHLVRVKILPDGTQIYDLDPNLKIPNAESAINVFFIGYDKEGQQYYTHTLISDELMQKYYHKGNLKRAKYSCPFCHMPLTKLTKSEWVCDSERCVSMNQEAKPIVYDTGYKKVKDSLEMVQMNDVWKAEEKVRLFVCNMLDYYMNKEIYFTDGLTEEQARKKNEKDAKRNKQRHYLVSPIKVVRCSPKIEKRIFQIKQTFGSYDYARKTCHWVEGHFMRFLNKDHYSNLYGWITGCRTAEEKREKLKELKRRDADGFEESNVYEWDELHDCIKVHVDEFQRNKDAGNPDDRTEYRVVK